MAKRYSDSAPFTWGEMSVDYARSGWLKVAITERNIKKVKIIIFNDCKVGVSWDSKYFKGICCVQNTWIFGHSKAVCKVDAIHDCNWLKTTMR